MLKDFHDKIFETKSFNAKDKNHLGGKSYLPLFFALFWQFAVTMQWATSIVLILRITLISTPFEKYTLFGWIALSILIGGFIGLSYFWRYYFFLKYKIVVEGIEPKRTWINCLFRYFLDEKCIKKNILKNNE